MDAEKKRQRNRWLALLITFLPLVWFIPGAIYMRNITRAQNKGCEANLKNNYKFFLQYASGQFGPRAHYSRLPDAKHWIEMIDNFGDLRLQCPADSDKQHHVSYAMNANLSGKKLSEIKDPHNTILLYETTSKESTPYGTGADLVRIGKDNVGVGRHHTIGYRFNYYLMADGTVRRPYNVDELKGYRWK
jgi:hypothetical protein